VLYYNRCVDHLLQLAQVTLAAVQAWKKLDDDTQASFEATAEGASCTAKPTVASSSDAQNGGRANASQHI